MYVTTLHLQTENSEKVDKYQMEACCYRNSVPWIKVDLIGHSFIVEFSRLMMVYKPINIIICESRHCNGVVC